jgi:hypothetical protein
LFFSKFHNGYKRVFFTGGKKEKDKDKSSEKKRPAEEGVSRKPPPPKRKFQQSWRSDLWIIQRDGAMFCTWCVEKKESVRFLVNAWLVKNCFGW